MAEKIATRDAYGAALAEFGERPKTATLDTVTGAVMPGDLAALCEVDAVTVNYLEFLAAVKEKL